LNSSAFWKSDWFVGLVVAVLFIVGYLVGFPPFQRIEQSAYDIGASASIKPASNQIIILDIDDASIDRIGRWPWSRSIIADMINKLSAAGARQIGLDIFFTERQSDDNTSQMIAFLKQQAKILQDQGRASEAAATLEKAENLDIDARLVKAVRQAGNVVMPILFDFGAGSGGSSAIPPQLLNRISTANVGGNPGLPSLKATSVRLPFSELAQASAGLGHLNIQLAPGGVVRNEPLVIEYNNRYYPSLSLAMAAQQLHISNSDIRVNLGSDIEMGILDVPTDTKMRAWPVFHTSSKDEGFKHYSFFDVYSGRIPPKLFQNKIVLIGITAKGVGNSFITPVSDQMSGVEFTANVLQSILNHTFFSRPAWAKMVELGILALIAIYLIALLPRLGAAASAIVSILLLLALLSVNFFALTAYSLWIQTMTASAMLILGHVLLTTKRYFASEEDRERITTESAETNKMLGLSFQSQGMLDMAFDKFRKCPINDDMLATLYNLALDFERKRQFNKASTVYEYMAESNPTYKDIQARILRAKNAGETMIFGTSGGSNMSTLLITGGAKPTLGRYEIVKELGRGAMGTVYLGRDPKINREVAIKTMALSQEFEPDELQEVKERFFREAETAGRLTHPNIVTIFDAGEEHDLAYIAMEYLNGTDLAPFTKKDKLLPTSAVLKITGKVAEALHYAHNQGVIHRDIKPANIMLLRNKTVKVTDFGIARITASSKTKTGVVLGTPSYMSPEQLSGKHVDGRSDLFSMGVMLYELLTGTRPFRGDSMATLMFQIANEPHPDIREHNPDLPESVSKMIDRLLAKEQENRYDNGGEVVRAIITCLNDVKAQEKRA
jgi:eukaryotic-like serine/threonine-protein kinase